MALRIARGLFRLWLVLSVLWIGWRGYLVWSDWAVRCEQGQFCSLAGIIYAEVPVAVIPPAFVLALGSALVWALRGFR